MAINFVENVASLPLASIDKTMVSINIKKLSLQGLKAYKRRKRGNSLGDVSVSVSVIEGYAELSSDTISQKSPPPVPPKDYPPPPPRQLWIQSSAPGTPVNLGIQRSASQYHPDRRIKLPVPKLAPHNQKQLKDLDLDFLALDLLDTQAFQSCLDLRRPSPVGVDDYYELRLPKCFRSLCLCDANANGYPVLMRSIYFTNSPRCLKDFPADLAESFETPECVVSDRPDSTGRPRFILQYFQGLISRETRAKPFVLAAQMNITDAMRSLTTDLIPLARRLSMGGDSEGEGDDNIDWIAAGASPPKPRLSMLSAIMQPLVNFHDYVKDLAFFHRNCIILSSSTTLAADSSRMSTLYPRHTAGETFWQISYASPQLFAQPADLEASLGLTDPDDLRALGEQLASQRPVAMRVRWGVVGTEMWMYCIPMIRGSRMDCYMAFLVEERIGNLWALAG